MNKVPLLLLPCASVINGLYAFKYHPDINYDKGVGYIEDLRANYLPAQSYGSVYFPFIKPVIATMPGLEKKCEAADSFFQMREFYLVHSHRFTWGIVNLTACTVAAVFLATLIPAFAFTAGAGVILVYLVVARLIHGYYETKADEYILRNATDDEKSAALGLIKALEEKAKTHKDVRIFPVLRQKLEALQVQPTQMPDDIFAEHDERKSTMGLPYTMRPPMEVFEDGAASEVKAIFLAREAFHHDLENNDFLTVAALVGFVTVTTVAASAEFFFNPALFAAGMVFMYGFYSVSHLIGDYYFKSYYDPENKIGQYLKDFPTECTRVYKGAY